MVSFLFYTLLLRILVVWYKQMIENWWHRCVGKLQLPLLPTGKANAFARTRMGCSAKKRYSMCDVACGLAVLGDVPGMSCNIRCRRSGCIACLWCDAGVNCNTLSRLAVKTVITVDNNTYCNDSNPQAAVLTTETPNTDRPRLLSPNISSGIGGRSIVFRQKRVCSLRSSFLVWHRGTTETLPFW